MKKAFATILLSFVFVLSISVTLVLAQQDHAPVPAGASSDAQPPITATTSSTIESTPDSIVLQLRSGAFDPLQGVPPVPTSLSRNLTAQEASLRLVQFSGPIQDEWYAAMIKSGLEVVTYMPDYAYLVWGDESALKALQAIAPVRWSGVYQPLYALEPQLAKTAQSTPEVEAIVQLVDQPVAAETIAAILTQAKVLRQPYTVLNYRNLGVRIASDQLNWLAALPGVVNVESYPSYQMLDEIQGQILAGNLNAGGTQPAGPGYLAWLSTTIGLPTDPGAYPIVDVTDDGIDNGTATPLHPDFWQFGNTTTIDRLAYNYNWSTDPLPNSVDGHGNINASIVAGYNDRSGFPYEDVSGSAANYNFGLGINPFGRVAGSKVFNNGGTWGASASNTAIISNSYALGARISSNSWGCGWPYCNGAPYTTDSQEYDALVRDAQPGTGAYAGNQPMLVVFAAGNDGSGARTIGSPATAKNVITVGAAENYRPTATDGCNVVAASADNAQDIVNSSSRGPTSDDRTKPDIMAPSTHIMGAASQDPGFSGAGVCGGNPNPPNQYFPAGQTLYTWSSGSSHSTPAIAGAASLVYRFYQDHFGGQPPSPAMLKAYLTNSARYLTGANGGGNLPTYAQGYGEAYLGQAFDNTPRFVVDQSYTFGSSGQTYVLQGSVADTGKPLRVTLAWTDAPGFIPSSAYVNNLDLVVTVGGNTYRGNVFTGQNSTTGGTADARNNLESVFLPAGVSGNFIITVTATNIAGDGVPGNGDATDQDFALVAYNSLGGMPTGILTGIATNSLSAAPVANAQITAQSSSITAFATTNAAGQYTFPNILSGTYTVTASATGYLSGLATGVTVNTGGTTTRNFALTPIALLNVAAVSTSDAGGNNNGSVEPGEVIRLEIGLKNDGVLTAAPVNGLVALTGGSATVSTPAAAYANIAPAATVTNTYPYVFQVSPTQVCGQPLTFGFTGTYNGAQTVNYAFSVPVGLPNTTPQVFQDFDGVTAPALPTGWTSTASGAQSTWVTQNTTSDSAPNNAFSPNPNAVGINELVTPVFTPTATTARITFRNYYILENTYDGTVLEIKIGGAAFTDILAAGGSFSTGGYNGTISTRFSNPLSGRSAWTGSSSGYITTTVNLPAAATGQPVQLRWQVGTDSSIAGTGQRVDTVQLIDGHLCSAPPSALTWTGNASTNWFVGSNWNPAGVPTTTSTVLIPTAPTGNRWPIITGTAGSYSLTIQAGAVVTIAQGAALLIDGGLTHNGTLAQIKDTPAGSTTEFLHLMNTAGNVDQYHGVDLTPGSTAMGVTTVQIKGNQSACTTVPGDPIIHRCYQIDPTTQTSATVRFWFTEAERHAQPANTLKLWHWGPWTQIGTTYTYSESGPSCTSSGGLACWFQSTGVATYSPFALGSGSAPTAVHLIHIDGRSSAALPLLPWGAAIALGLSVSLIVLKRRRS
jgi:hypothetical protein